MTAHSRTALVNHQEFPSLFSFRIVITSITRD